MSGSISSLRSTCSIVTFHRRKPCKTGWRWGIAGGSGFPFRSRCPYNRANLPAGFAISSAEDMAHFLIAQMNGGRYRDDSVLSPEGIALMQAEPPPGAYGLGWESVRIDGRRLINFDGATGNYQCSVFIDPEAGWACSSPPM